MISRAAVKKNGITLIELIVTMVLAGILITAMICQFVALIRFNKTVESVSGQTRETPLAVREARIVLRSLTDVLRFATLVTPGTPGANTFTADIEGGHVVSIPTTRTVTYKIVDNGPEKEFRFSDPIAGTDVVISKNVSQLDASWANKETTLKLIFFDDNGNMPIETKIKALI